jgi:hypothetical protein
MIQRPQTMPVILMLIIWFRWRMHLSQEVGRGAQRAGEHLQMIPANWLLHQRLRIDRKVPTHLINGDHQTVTLGAHMPTAG